MQVAGITIGVIPSMWGKDDPRFDGEAGFSNYRGPTRLFPTVKWPYKIQLHAVK